MEEYTFRNGKRLRTGFTTGLCAAAAAKAAVTVLLTGEVLREVEIAWQPAEGKLRSHVFRLEHVERTEEAALCGVRKDAGDDADVTDGMLILAEARLPDADNALGQADSRTAGQASPEVRILGGEGVGRVTLPGLDQPVGEAAINSGPRRMIREAVRSAWNEYADGPGIRTGELTITISVPGGAEIAEKTFNPVLGIEGGISILGTTGIVDPMSGAAAEESVRTDIRMKCAQMLRETGPGEEGRPAARRNGGIGDTAAGSAAGSAAEAGILLTPGNTGAAFAEKELGIRGERIVLCSNYFGAAIDEACLQGVGKILLIGALGKMIKLAGGIFNTHSYESDARLDILMRCALKAGADQAVLRAMDACVTTESALSVLREAGLAEKTAELVRGRALMYVRRRCGRREDAPACEMILISNRGERLAASAESLSMAAELAGHADAPENICTGAEPAGNTDAPENICTSAESAGSTDAADSTCAEREPAGRSETEKES